MYSLFTSCLAGVGLGVVGFAPLLFVVLLARKKRIKPTMGKGFAALGASFAFLMLGIAMAWNFAPGDILSVTTGALVGFLAMWAALAVISMGRRL